MSDLSKAVFLDRDGVVNIDTGYLSRPQDLVWMPGAPEAIRLLNEKGYKVFIVTNQSGIARGYFTEEEFILFAHWMESELAGMGASIQKTFYCPHHPTHGQEPYLRVCDCRKPKPGMILSVLESGDYDLRKCFLIGDNVTDVQAATAAGIRGFLFREPNLLDFVVRILAHE